MFYSKFMFVKKGPLAKVWLAAHAQKKLTKHLVQQTNITDTVENIVNPAAPLALRVSGQLLLGLVRIFQKKVRYLQEDCSDAMAKMKMVNRTGAVDLPPDANTAAAHAITLPDAYGSFDIDIPDIPIEDLLNDEMERNFTQSIARAADITMEEREDLPIPMDTDVDMRADKSEVVYDGVAEELPIDTGDVKFNDSIEVGRAAAQDDVIPFNDDVMEMQMPFEPQGDKPEQLSFADISMQHDAAPAAADAAEPAAEAAPQRVARKRKLERIERADKETELSKQTIAAQLEDTSDIVTRRPPVPLTKRQRLADEQKSASVLSIFSGMQYSLPAELLEMAQVAMVSDVRDGIDLPMADAMEEDREEKKAEAEESRVEEPEQGRGEHRVIETGVDESFYGGFDGPDMQMPVEPTEQLPNEYGMVPEATQPVDKPSKVFTADDTTTEGKRGSAADGFSRRTKKMYDLLDNAFNESETVTLAGLVTDESAETAAGIFYELLVLKTHQYIEVQQDEPFEDIVVSKSDTFTKPFPVIA